MSGGGGSSAPSTSNTVTQVQSVPDYIQAEGQANQQLANDISSSPYPVYQGQMIAPMDPLQTAGQQMAINSAGSYQPYLNQAGADTQSAMNLTSPNAISQYMSPYIQASLAPQLSDLGLQQAANQQQINSQATQAGAFGDARQGTESALNNYMNGQQINQATGAAYQNAFTAANQALGTAQGTQLNAANLEGALGGQAQQYGLNAANAVYGAGAQNQAQAQSELNNSYQQYLNQVNWPYQMLNVREGAIANNPYNIQTATTLPAANTTAQGFSAITGLAGLANTLTATSGTKAPTGTTS